MFVLIAGGGRTGTQLAHLLISQNHHVHMVEHRKGTLARLHRDLPSEIIYEGFPTDTSILLQARIEEADVVAATTTDDADNLAICYLARERYKVPRTVARINDPRNAWLFNDTFKVDAALNQSEMMGSMILEEVAHGDMVTLLKLQKGAYSLIEERIAEGAKGVGVPLKDLGLPEHCVIAAIIRDGEVVVPRGVTAFAAGDQILAVTDNEGADQLSVLFGPPKPAPGR